MSIRLVGGVEVFLLMTSQYQQTAGGFGINSHVNGIQYP